MNLLKMGVEGWLARNRPKRCKLFYLASLLLVSACGSQKPVIPDEIEPIARRCYETLVTPERTPKLNPSESMEDGTFLILWYIDEFPDEQGSCTVDGSGVVLLLTSNADKQPPPEQTPTP
ncbi:MAG: hypothetical protein AAGA46_00960 [Cyanobacteria bacterium P01_F01_bin.13]